MNSFPRRFFALPLVALTLAAAASQAFAQTYPNRPIRLINPWTTGGPAEIVARLVGGKLQEALGQSVVVESKPGANGTIGAQLVAQSAPDGYTLLVSHVGPMAISPAVVSKMPYDTLKDFEAISLLASGALVMLVRNDVPAQTPAELIAWAKANPDRATCGSVGAGSTSHLACEQLNMLGGTRVIHVPYKGAAPVVTDMLGGSIAISFLNIAGVRPQLEARQLRPIAVTTTKRSSALPELPAMAELLPGFDVNSWYGLMAPAGTPKAIVDRIQSEVARALRQPDVAERLKGLGLDPVGSTPEAHAKQLREELVHWARLARAANLKVE